MQRALVLLGIAAGERVTAVAERVGCDPATVWRFCRRFEAEGVASVTSLSMPRLRESSGTAPDAVAPPADVGAGSCG
jgi:hypothetical protein